MATCFFLDCAHNIIDFIEIIHQILKVRCLDINFIEIIHQILKVRCLSIVAVPIGMLLTLGARKRELTSIFA